MATKAAQFEMRCYEWPLMFSLRLTACSDELLTPRRLEILAMEISQLQQRLRTGELSPLEVLEAYQVLGFYIEIEIVTYLKQVSHQMF